MSIAAALRAVQRPFAVVGGLAISVRGEPRFTRDVDVVVVAKDDADMEMLVFGLANQGYRTVALVEHESRARLSTVRLSAPGGLIVDLPRATAAPQLRRTEDAHMPVVEVDAEGKPSEPPAQ
jgi:hypothetical protein